jgi:pimeloyl-ACP methyl ester carboxylesterase
MSSPPTTPHPAPGSRKLHIRTWSDAKPAVLLIHGLGDGSFVWEPVIRHIGRPLAAAAVDLCGHGESEWDPLRRYGARAHAADVAHVLVSSGWNRITLVGHSFGANVAIHVAARFPRRVRALVLVDGAPDLRGERLRQQFGSQSWHYGSVADYAEGLRKRMPLARRAVLEQVAQNALGPPQRHGFSLKCDPALYEYVPPPNKEHLWADLQSIRCPILLVRGARSSALPESVARAVTERVPNCRLATVPAAGHAIMLDNPAGLCEAIGTFLGEIVQSSA